MTIFRIVMFWAILAALMGSLIIYGKCQAHPAYDERGNIVGETLEAHTDSVYEAQGERTTLDLRFKEAPAGKEEKPSLQGVVIGGHLEYPSECGEYPGILDLLRECLEYIRDSSVVYNDPSDHENFQTKSTLAIYELRSAQTDADEAAQTAQERADRIKAQAEQLRKETELHKKIKAMIKKLEGENK